MAIVQTNYGLDFDALDFHQVTSNATASWFFDDANIIIGGRTYNDVIRVDWQDGGLFQSFFGGSGIVIDAFGQVAGGTATGYLLLAWNGSAWKPSWSIQDISVPAAVLYDAFRTPGTSDDGAVIQQALGGHDTITGSAFADRLHGYDGNDRVLGGDGNDVLRGGSGSNVLDGGSGAADLADYGDQTSAVTMMLSGSGGLHVTVGGFGTDDLLDIENITGGSADDVLIGDGQTNELAGNAGDDSLSGGAGGDTLIGDAGNDVLRGGLGSDTLDGGSGDSDRADYGDRTETGADAVVGGAGVETIAYATAAQSTGLAFDTLTRCDAAQDRLDLWVGVTRVDPAVTTGALSHTTFDADLAAAADGLAAGCAMLFTADAGASAGDTFLLVDTNGLDGYQAGSDLVVRFVDPSTVGTLGPGSFV